MTLLDTATLFHSMPCYNAVVDWSSAYEAVSQYIVSIETPEGRGTGFLYTHNRASSLMGFATAAHVIAHANDWRLPIKLTRFATGAELFLREKDRIIFVDRTRDAASILTFGGKELGLPSKTLPLIAKTKLLSVGTEVAWVGFPCVADSHLCFFSGRISAQNKDEDSYYIDGVAINGVSGGPVFYVSEDDPKPRAPTVIGIVTAYKYNETYTNALPGLLQAQDLKPFHENIHDVKAALKSLREEASSQ